MPTTPPHSPFVVNIDHVDWRFSLREILGWAHTVCTFCIWWFQMPLEPQPPPSPLGKASKRPRHHCDSLISCALRLSDIGKGYHAFPKGTFHACYIPPTTPHSVLCYYMANPFSWSWTTKAGPKVGQTFSVPTIPISCKKDDHKAIHWTVSLFHSFKIHLHPEAMNLETGRVLSSFVRIYQNNMLLHFRSQIRLKIPQSTSKDPSPPQPPSSHPMPSHTNMDNVGFDARHEIAELRAEIAELRSQLRSIIQPHKAFSSPTSPITAPTVLPPPHQSLLRLTISPELLSFLFALLSVCFR